MGKKDEHIFTLQRRKESQPFYNLTTVCWRMRETRNRLHRNAIATSTSSPCLFASK